MSATVKVETPKPTRFVEYVDPVLRPVLPVAISKPWVAEESLWPLAARLEMLTPDDEPPGAGGLLGRFEALFVYGNGKVLVTGFRPIVYSDRAPLPPPYDDGRFDGRGGAGAAAGGAGAGLAGGAAGAAGTAGASGAAG